MVIVFLVDDSHEDADDDDGDDDVDDDPADEDDDKVRMLTLMTMLMLMTMGIMTMTERMIMMLDAARPSRGHGAPRRGPCPGAAARPWRSEAKGKGAAARRKGHPYVDIERCESTELRHGGAEALDGFDLFHNRLILRSVRPRSCATAMPRLSMDSIFVP